MKIAIGKTYHLSASHQLKYLPDGHPCARLHGHNYEITVVVSGQIGDENFVIDYHQIDRIFGDKVMGWFDHQHLNDVLNSPNGGATTAELLCSILFRYAVEWFNSEAPLVAVQSITVKETGKTFATITA